MHDAAAADRRLLAGALSLALPADAGHLVSDVAALGFAIAAAAPAAGPARGRWTYGFRRLEILSAELNGLALASVAIWIVYGAVRRLVSPASVRGGVVVAVAVCGIAVNLAATALLARAGRESLNVRGAFLHVATDLVAFVGAPVAGGLVLASGWDRLDPLAGLLVAALMLWAAFGLLRDSMNVFLEASPTNIEPGRSRDRRRARRGGGSRPPRLGRWRAGFPVVSAHVLVGADADCHAARRRLEAMPAERFGREHSTLQVEHAPDRSRSAPLSAAARPSAARVAPVPTLEGKTAIVTGASSGIGAATAKALRAEGARVAVGARRAELLEGDFAHELDVTDPDSCARFVEAALDALGGLDVLVNNAGGALGRYPFWESNEDDEEWMIEANVHGLMRVTRLCLPHIRDGGHIVNIDSIAGRAAYENAAVYCAVKAATAMFSQALREDLLGRPIRVTSIAPGLVETNFSLVRFKGDAEKAAKVYEGLEPMTAEDVAGCILFAVTRPLRMNVDEIVIKALAQTSGGRIHRRT